MGYWINYKQSDRQPQENDKQLFEQLVKTFFFNVNWYSFKPQDAANGTTKNCFKLMNYCFWSLKTRTENKVTPSCQETVFTNTYVSSKVSYWARNGGGHLGVTVFATGGTRKIFSKS